MLSGTSFLTPLYAGEDYIAPSGYRHKAVVCRCELCGTIKTVMVSNLPRTKSCGCAKLQFIREANSTHGESKTRLYRIWSLMKDRCTNPNAEHYDLYGGRGIAVCDEWLQYEPFREWALSNGYRKELSIDRIDNDKGYEPSNCRWATQLEQANNKRTNIVIAQNGETKTLGEWAAQLGMEPRALWWRLYNDGWSEADAVSVPKGMRRSTYHKQQNSIKEVSQ